jgi:SOS-response transcriptional repressor LexA
MPGGSGLLDQICLRFDEIVVKAIDIANGCPSNCERACIDCLMTFRNAFYSNFLDRKCAAEWLEQLGPELAKLHDIPPKHGKKGPGVAEMPVNQAEARLNLLIERAQFPDPEWHKEIPLKFPLKQTIPDAFYDSERSEGIAIYLDGLSQHIHGNPSTHARDEQIRAQLEADGFDVLAITATELYDEDAMAGHLAKIARWLIGKLRANEVKADHSWWVEAEVTATAAAEATAVAPEENVLPFDLVGHDEDQEGTVILTTLRAAAGAWGSPQEVEVLGRVRLRQRVGDSDQLFVARIEGHSMEDRIPDGSYCLFRWYSGGSRSGKIVLAEHHSIDDRDTGSSYTIKKFESEKRVTEDSFEHTRIRLLPLNPAYEPIEITVEDAEQVRVIAELIEVLR